MENALSGIKIYLHLKGNSTSRGSMVFYDHKLELERLAKFASRVVACINR